MKKVIAILVLTAGFSFGQSVDLMSFKVPAYKVGQLLADPDHLLSKQGADKVIAAIKKGPMPTVVFLKNNLPLVTAEHRYPAGDMADLLAKNNHLGEFAPKQPSLVVVMTNLKGVNPARSLGINVKNTPEKVQKAIDSGHSIFRGYANKPDLRKTPTASDILAEAIIQALTEGIWPALT